MRNEWHSRRACDSRLAWYLTCNWTLQYFSFLFWKEIKEISVRVFLSILTLHICTICHYCQTTGIVGLETKNQDKTRKREGTVMWEDWGKDGHAVIAKRTTKCFFEQVNLNLESVTMGKLLKLPSWWIQCLTSQWFSDGSIQNNHLEAC